MTTSSSRLTAFKSRPSFPGAVPLITAVISVVCLGLFAASKSTSRALELLEESKKDDLFTITSEYEITPNTCRGVSADDDRTSLQAKREYDDGPISSGDSFEGGASFPESLMQYIKFHRKGRDCLLSHIDENYESVGQKCELKDVPDIITWRGQNSKGGFGDRMIAIRHVLMFSIITNRLLFISWTVQSPTPYGLTAAFLPNYIDWRMPERMDRTDLGALLNKTILSDVELKSTYDERKEITRISNPFPHSQEVINLTTTNFEDVFKPFSIIQFKFIFLLPKASELLSRNQHGLNQNRLVGIAHENAIQLQRFMANVLFKPSDVIDFLSKRRSFATPLDARHQHASSEYIAVHIRVGTDVSESKDQRFSHLQCNDSLIEVSQKFLNCIERINSKYHGNDKIRNIFLATDSLPLKEIFVKEADRYNEENSLSVCPGLSCNTFKDWLGLRTGNHPIVVHTNKRFAWHLDKGSSGHFINSTDHCLAYLDIFADAYAVSRAKTVLYFRSNFPEVAIGMGKVSSWYQLESSKEALKEDECFESSMATVDNPTYGGQWYRVKNNYV